MNKTYQELPEELKILADNIDKPYNENYNYIKDMDKFVKYEKEVKGLTHLNISSGIYGNTSSPNQIAYTFIQLCYSPTLIKQDCTGVFF